MNHFLKAHGFAGLALALLLAIAAPVWADETRGTIAWLEPADHTITVVDETNHVLEMQFSVAGQLTINGKEATMWDLAAGDQVHVTFDRTDGQMWATAIQAFHLK